MSDVGDAVVPKIIAKIGDVKRFRNGWTIVVFTGIDSSPHKSGQFVGTKRKIFKRAIWFM